MKLKTGISGLDEMLHGGVYEKSATSINGPAGSGKTTLCLQFLVGGVQNNEAGLYVTFEQFPEQLYRDAKNFGWDLEKWEKEGKVKVLFTSPEEFATELETQLGLIDQLVIEKNIKRIVIDPVSYFRFLVNNTNELRRTYYKLINGLKRAGLTSLLACETTRFFGSSGEIDEELAFVVDNIIILRYVEIESSIQHAIAIVKSRGSQRAKDIRQYDITDKGIVVTSTFKGQEGILTGIPRKSIAEKVAREFEL